MKYFEGVLTGVMFGSPAMHILMNGSTGILSGIALAWLIGLAWFAMKCDDKAQRHDK